MPEGLTIGRILDYARQAKAQTGRPVIAQLIEMIRLRYGGNGIQPEYYFNYRLFSPDMPWAKKKMYIGPWIKKRIYRVQDAETVELALSKLRTYALLGERGLRYPPVLAATHPDATIAGIVELHSPEELAAWLRELAPYPHFAKPSGSLSGYGAKLIASHETVTDELVFGNGDHIGVDEFSAKHGNPAAPAMIFQELIRPHPTLEAVIGNRVATARIMVLNDRPEPEIVSAGLRFPVGNNMTDNFQRGRSGNLLAFIDLETGHLRVILGGIGLNWREVDVHPDTGQKIIDFQVPDWEDAKRLVIAGSKALPGLKIHGWDVAFSDRGPMLVETNADSAFNIIQLQRGEGLANPRFLELYPGGRL